MRYLYTSVVTSQYYPSRNLEEETNGDEKETGRKGNGCDGGMRLNYLS
jgi:hypothetical protein